MALSRVFFNIVPKFYKLTHWSEGEDQILEP